MRKRLLAILKVFVLSRRRIALAALTGMVVLFGCQTAGHQHLNREIEQRNDLSKAVALPSDPMDLRGRDADGLISGFSLQQ